MLEYLDILKYGLIIALTTALGKYLARQGEKAATTNVKGHTILRQPLLYGVIGLGSALLGFGLLNIGLDQF